MVPYSAPKPSASAPIRVALSTIARAGTSGGGTNVAAAQPEQKKETLEDRLMRIHRVFSSG